MTYPDRCRTLFAFETPAVAARNHARVLDAAAEKEIEHYADDGQQKQDCDPRQRLNGITVFRNYDAYDRDDRGEIDSPENVVNPAKVNILHPRLKHSTMLNINYGRAAIINLN